MHIKKLRIQNYKSFRDSGFMEFGPGFNVIVGQNNSGKTALLEALMLHNTPSKPHKDASDPAGQPIDEHSTFEIDLNITGRELIEAILRTCTIGDLETLESAKMLAPESASADETEVAVGLLIPAGSAWKSRVSEPAFDFLWLMAGGGLIGEAEVKHRRDVFRLFQDRSRSDLVNLIYGGMSSRLYGFKAERLNVAASFFDDTEVLAPNASNLASVLGKFFDKKTGWTKRFVDAVSLVLPSIEDVQSRQAGNSNRKIFIRNQGTDPDRSDLANSLDECGAGVGQVLAILYVAMTMQPSIIMIDEPNSFLHPGAAKKLLQILAGYDHQYFISTHSPEIVSSLNASSLHLVEWRDGESHVRPINVKEQKDQRHLLSELGISLSDLFAADRIIWVEGKTEQICFPILVQNSGKKAPLGLAFLGVLQTSDFETTGKDAKRFLDLYRRATAANGLMPTTFAVSLDKEDRSVKDQADLKREFDGKLHFLPRRCYENYLLHPRAIAAVLSGFLNGEVVSDTGVETWMQANSRALTTDGSNWPDKTFRESVDGAKLLKKMFSELSDTKVEFRKVIHSVKLTEWLLKHEPETLADLTTYVLTLLTIDGTA